MNESGNPFLVDDLPVVFEAGRIVQHLPTRAALALPDIRGDDRLREGIRVKERDVQVQRVWCDALARTHTPLRSGAFGSPYQLRCCGGVGVTRARAVAPTTQHVMPSVTAANAAAHRLERSLTRFPSERWRARRSEQS